MTTDNTPLNADDELRDKIDKYLSHFEVSVDGIGDVGLFDLVHPRIKDKHGHGVEWAIVISDRIMEAALDWHNKQVERWFQILIDVVGYEKARAYKESMKYD